jgi:hypothetical protein
MSSKILFIYKVTSPAAIWVVIAHDPDEAANLVIVPDNIVITVVKLGCVTADRKDDVELGVINRQWRCDA